MQELNQALVILVVALLALGHAEVIVAAEIDVVVGRIAIVVDVLDVVQLIDVIAAQIGGRLRPSFFLFFPRTESAAWT